MANHIGLSCLCNEIWRNFNIKIEQEVRGYVQAFLCNLAKISNPREEKKLKLIYKTTNYQLDLKCLTFTSNVPNSKS